MHNRVWRVGLHTRYDASVPPQVPHALDGISVAIGVTSNEKIRSK
jgi:hypothetical protein